MRLFSSSDKHSLKKVRSQYLVQVNLVAASVYLLLLQYEFFSLETLRLLKAINRMFAINCYGYSIVTDILSPDD